MKPITLTFWLLLTVNCFCQSLIIDNNQHDFGQVKGPESVSERFSISNVGSHTLYINKLQVSCRCLSAQIGSKRIPAGQSSFIDVLLNPNEIEGKINQFVSIFSNSKNSHFSYLDIKANVNPTWRITPRLIRLESADFSSETKLFKTRFLIENLGSQSLTDVRFETHGKISLKIVGNTKDPILNGHMREFDLSIQKVSDSKGNSVKGYVKIFAKSSGIKLTKRLVIQIENRNDNQRSANNISGAAIENDRRSGEVLAKLNSLRIQSKNLSSVDAMNFAMSKQCKGMEIISRDLVCLLLYRGESIEQAVTRLEDDRDFSYVQPNYLYTYRGVPSDPCFSNQYSLRNNGQNIPILPTNGALCTPLASGTFGTPGADIQIIDAWDIFTGTSAGKGGMVAVLDVGVDYNHEDLVSRMWDGAECLDWNGNQLENCIHGYDFSDQGDLDPFPNSGEPRNHGTRIAGIIGAEANNNKGITGVNWHSQLMAIRSDGSFITTSEFVRGVDFVEKNGTSIINASFGRENEQCQNLLDRAFYDAIAGFNGIIIMPVANSNSDHNGMTWFDSADHGHDVICNEKLFDESPIWPGLSNVINVAASDNNDVKSSFSDFGVNVDLAAPGVGIYSTDLRAEEVSNYNYDNGTSFAAPLVTGVVSLLWGYQPYLSPEKIRHAVISNSDCIDTFGQALAPNSNCVDGQVARLNAYNILAVFAVPTITNLQAFTGSDKSIPIAAGTNSDDNSPYWEWDVPVGQGIITEYMIEIDQGNTFMGNVSEPKLDYEFICQGGLSAGNHELTVVGVNDQGAMGDVVTHSFTVLSVGTPHIILINDGPLSVNEGQPVTFQIELVNTADEPISIDYEIEESQPGTDSIFVNNTGQVKWERLESGQRSVTLNTINNTIDEINKSFSLEIKNPSNADLICHTNIEIIIIDNDVNINLMPGWNLVSIPYTLIETDVATIFNLKSGDFIWQWNTEKNLYTIPKIFNPQDGYWLYSATSRQISIEGMQTSSHFISLSPGWNLVGVSRNMSVQLVNSSIKGAIWGWDGTFNKESQNLIKNKAYWIYREEDKISIENK